MNSKSKGKKNKIDLTPQPGQEGRKKSDEIIDEAERITRQRADGSVRDARGRKTKEEEKSDKKLKEMEKAANVLFTTSLTGLVGAVTTVVAFVADDQKWQSRGEELDELTATVVGYIDLKYPDWRTASPERFLVLGLIGYITPRIGILEKKRIKDNPYKDWFKNFFGKFKRKNVDIG